MPHDVPIRLYKYRPFSDLTINSVIMDKIFYADPSTFNDPLDTKPTLETDIDISDLESVLFRLVEQRVSKEMSAAAKKIKYSDSRTYEHIADHSRKVAQQLIGDVYYNASNPEYEMENPEKLLFGHHIEDELLRRYDKGVFSLAKRPNCPLMWSHYGDQHRGLCIGYSIPHRVTENLHKVTYGGSRLIKASKVKAMLGGDEDNRREVDKGVLAKKAGAWRYENEWRLIGSRGLQDSPLELEEIIFGMRCPEVVKYSIIKSLMQRDRPVKFFQIRGQYGNFSLKSTLVDIDETLRELPRRSNRVYELFQNLAIEVPN